MARNNTNRALREFLFNEKDISFTIKGNSMNPLYASGEKIKALPFSGTLKKGKNYIFLYNKNLVFHRFICMSGKQAVFSGDNAYTVEKISPESVVGELDHTCNNQKINCIIIINILYYKLRLYNFCFSRIRKSVIYFLLANCK